MIVSIYCSLFGAGGGTWTHMYSRTSDFESDASAIPPHQHIAEFSFINISQKHKFINSFALLFTKNIIFVEKRFLLWYNSD